MTKNLFGNTFKKRKSLLEARLAKYDRDSFNDRLERLKYLQKIFPKGLAFSSRLETAYVFDEAKMAFINGEFISTIMLAQAFIEHRLQSLLIAKGLVKESKKGIKFIIDYCRTNNLIGGFLLDKIDYIRKIRNPFSHLKDYDYSYNIDQRLMTQLRNTKSEENRIKDPAKILEADANEAILLMYTIVGHHKYLLV